MVLVLIIGILDIIGGIICITASCFESAAILDFAVGVSAIISGIATISIYYNILNNEAVNTKNTKKINKLMGEINSLKTLLKINSEELEKIMIEQNYEIDKEVEENIDQNESDNKKQIIIDSKDTKLEENVITLDTASYNLNFIKIDSLELSNNKVYICILGINYVIKFDNNYNAAVFHNKLKGIKYNF